MGYAVELSEVEYDHLQEIARQRGSTVDALIHDWIQGISSSASNADAMSRWKALNIADTPTEADLNDHPLLRGVGLFNTGAPHWADRH